MADRDDLVMESTTDSPEQIAAGLGVEVEEPIVETADGEAGAAIEDPPAEEAEVEAEADPDPDPDPEPEAEVTPEPKRLAAPKPKAVARPKKLVPRNVNGAIAAVRREAEAKTRLAESERDAALARVKELTTGVERPEPRAERAPAATKPVVSTDIPDSHPRVASLLAQITALGAKPKQADFADFDEFEEKKDTWIEERARLRARVDSVREDVARTATLEADEANRAAAETTSKFQQSEEAARERHDDYDEQIEAARAAGLRVSDDIGTALLESPHGGELRYYLCANPKEVARLMTLRPHRQIAELGIIESRIVAGLPDATEQKRPVARVTRAPEPQQHLIGDVPSLATRFKSREDEMNHPATTQARYNQLRNQMDVDSGRRTH